MRKTIKEKYSKILEDHGINAEEFLGNLEKDLLGQGSFAIKCSWTTGDSFSSYETSETLEYVWHSKDIVDENYRRLKEHLEMYKDLHGYSRETWESKREKWKTKEWSCYEDGTLNDYQVKLLGDSEEEMIIYIPWVGYFERDQDLEMVIINT